jgi:hypothetical protein
VADVYEDAGRRDLENTAFENFVTGRRREVTIVFKKMLVIVLLHFNRDGGLSRSGDGALGHRGSRCVVIGQNAPQKANTEKSSSPKRTPEYVAQ